MPCIQTLHLEAADATRHRDQPDDIVRCGPMGAAWRIISRVDGDDRSTLLLAPVDAHDVPLNARVNELPAP